MLKCLEYVEGRVVFVCFLTEVTNAGKKEEETSKVAHGTQDKSIFTELCRDAWASLVNVLLSVT